MSLRPWPARAPRRESPVASALVGGCCRGVGGLGLVGCRCSVRLGASASGAAASASGAASGSGARLRSRRAAASASGAGASVGLLGLGRRDDVGRFGLRRGLGGGRRRSALVGVGLGDSALGHCGFGGLGVVGFGSLGLGVGRGRLGGDLRLGRRCRLGRRFRRGVGLGFRDRGVVGVAPLPQAAAVASASSPVDDPERASSEAAS